MEQYLTLLDNRTRAMTALTEELFRYSVILSTDDALHLESVDLKAVLEESVAGPYGALTRQGITPEIQMPEFPVVRQLDRNSLSRIFGNILTNAIKYSAGDLSITLRPEGDISSRIPHPAWIRCRWSGGPLHRPGAVHCPHSDGAHGRHHPDLVPGATSDHPDPFSRLVPLKRKGSASSASFSSTFRLFCFFLPLQIRKIITEFSLTFILSCAIMVEIQNAGWNQRSVTSCPAQAPSGTYGYALSGNLGSPAQEAVCHPAGPRSQNSSHKCTESSPLLR